MSWWEKRLADKSIGSSIEVCSRIEQDEQSIERKSQLPKTKFDNKSMTVDKGTE